MKLDLILSIRELFLLQMAIRRELPLQEKIDLIKEKERGSSHRQLSERFRISIGSVSNIVKRKLEYTEDYETNRNKKINRRCREDSNQDVNEGVYEWFVAQRSKNIPISGPILQEYARNYAQTFDQKTTFKASNGWLDRFRTRFNITFRAISGESRSVDENTIIDWRSRLGSIIEHYDPKNVFNRDETGLFL